MLMKNGIKSMVLANLWMDFYGLTNTAAEKEIEEGT